MFEGEELHLPSSIQNQKAYDTWAATYDLDRPPHTYLEEPMVLKLLDLQKDDVILDAACGTGRYAKLALNRGAQVFACDFSKQMLDQARVHAPGADFQQVDLCVRMPYSNSQFSKIICSLAIRHVESIQFCFQEFHRLLKPGGILVFSSIHPEMDWSNYERSSPPPIELNTEGKTFFYSVSDMADAAANAGFESIQKMDVLAGEEVRNWLTETSARAQIGKKFVAIFSCKKSLS